MTRIYERGSASVVGYIVVGVILAVIVVGGVYVAKHQLAAHFAKPGNGSSTVVTVDGDQNASIDTTKNDNNKKQTDNSDKTTTKNDSSSKSTNETQKSDSSTKTAKNESSLPATGTSGALGEASALAILTGAGVAFLRSRRS